MLLFSLALVFIELLAICDFLLNKSRKIYLRPMLPPCGRNWQLISLIDKIENGQDGKIFKQIFVKLLFQNGKLTKKNQVY